jgi:ABC-2 type transport system ATP-binding protein
MAAAQAVTVLERAGATVMATGPGTLTVTGLGAGRVAALLGEHAVPLSEISEHRATLEEAYMGLTRDAVEYRAEPAGSPGGTRGAGGTAAQAGTGEAGR